MSRSYSNFTYKRLMGKFKKTNQGILSKEDNGNSNSKRSKSKNGQYTTAITKRYEHITDNDLELKESYGISLIARFHQIKRNYLHLEPYNDNFNKTSQTYNYYVRMGKSIIGKLSIRIQYSLNGTHLIYNYMKKKHIKF